MRSCYVATIPILHGVDKLPLRQPSGREESPGKQSLNDVVKAWKPEREINALLGEGFPV